jgi:aminoglycoside 2'-N-acetyltransferase I
MTSEIDVRMLPPEDLTPSHRTEIIDVCIAAHDVQDFETLFSVIPSGGRHVLAYDGSRLVSHAVATTRWAQPDGHDPLKTAYIDAVSTLPAYQGRGYGSAAMRRLAAEVDDYEIGCLQTDKPGFYDRLGWELWRGPLAGRTEEGLVPTPDQQGVMVLRLRATPSLDLDAGLSIEQQPSRFWE